MAKLCFKYAAMNSGKTIDLLRTAYNYEENGYKVLVLKPLIDSKGGDNVVTRIGLSRKTDYLISDTDNIIELLKDKLSDISAIFVDEAQFLKSEQIDELFKIAHLYDVAVICYGLRTDFQTKSFSGSKRLFELAEDIQELKTMCKCGKTARFNARKVNGVFVSSGDSVVIDGTDCVEYVPLCGDCYLEKVKNEKVKSKIKTRKE